MAKAMIVSPSGFLPDEKCIEKGISYLKSLGLEPVFGKHFMAKHRYMGGSAKERAQDLMDAFKDKEVKVIFCSCGGAGSQFVLDELDYKIIKKNPKPVVGFSDNTALQLALNEKAGIIGYTGFSLKYDFKDEGIDPREDKSFRQLMNKEKFTAKGGKTIIKGKAEGVLVGGCLSLLRNLCGTPYYPNLDGKVLLIEDIAESTYKVDLMLKQVKQCKGFNKLKGIVFGQFVGCEEKDKGDGTMEEIIKEFSLGLKIPVIMDFPYSHDKSRYVLPIGGKVVLDAGKCTLDILEY